MGIELGRLGNEVVRQVEKIILKVFILGEWEGGKERQPSLLFSKYGRDSKFSRRGRDRL